MVSPTDETTPDLQKIKTHDKLNSTRPQLDNVPYQEEPLESLLAFSENESESEYLTELPTEDEIEKSILDSDFEKNRPIKFEV